MNSFQYSVISDQHSVFRFRFCFAVAIIASLFWFAVDALPTANAHGTAITYTATYTVQGNFESGEPMSNAEVSIFAPDDPESPWDQGLADEEGYYTFTPDHEKTGEWSVSYRSAGHGDIAYIPVGGGVGFAGALTGGLQRLVMVAAVIWGFVGTALYYQAKQGAGGKGQTP